MLPPIHHKSSTASELTSLADTVFSGRRQSIREDMSDLSERSSIDHYSSYTPSRHKSVTERDSDEWHSESEANWTTIGMSSKHIPDDDDVKDDHKVVDIGECTVNTQKMELLKNQSNQQDSSTLTALFEPPRPSEVFDPGSWNRLRLAQHVNFVHESKFTL